MRSTYNPADFRRTLTAILGTIVFSTVCIGSAVGPATAHAATVQVAAHQIVDQSQC